MAVVWCCCVVWPLSLRFQLTPCGVGQLPLPARLFSGFGCFDRPGVFPNFPPSLPLPLSAFQGTAPKSSPLHAPFLPPDCLILTLPPSFFFSVNIDFCGDTPPQCPRCGYSLRQLPFPILHFSPPHQVVARALPPSRPCFSQRHTQVVVFFSRPPPLFQHGADSSFRPSFDSPFVSIGRRECAKPRPCALLPSFGRQIRSAFFFSAKSFQCRDLDAARRVFFPTFLSPAVCDFFSTMLPRDLHPSLASDCLY